MIESTARGGCAATRSWTDVDDERAGRAPGEPDDLPVVARERLVHLTLEPLPLVVRVVPRFTCEDEALERGDYPRAIRRVGGCLRGRNRHRECDERAEKPTHPTREGKSRAAR